MLARYGKSATNTGLDNMSSLLRKRDTSEILLVLPIPIEELHAALGKPLIKNSNCQGKLHYTSFTVYTVGDESTC